MLKNNLEFFRKRERERERELGTVKRFVLDRRDLDCRGRE